MSRPALEPVERAPAVAATSEEPEPRMDGAGNVIEVDGSGRYVLPHPESGDPAKWLRVTEFIAAIDDTTALHQWELRSLFRACAERPEMLRLARPAGDGSKWAQSAADNDLVGDLLGGAHQSAATGTSLHSLLEVFDRDGTEPEDESRRPFVLAYAGALRRTALSSVPDRIERVVVNLEHPVGRRKGLAGTVDRWLMACQPLDLPDGSRVEPGQLVVADIKTGQRPPDDKFVAAKNARQLAAYQQAAWMWDGGGYVTAPESNAEWGIVVHAPAEADPPSCALWWVPLAAARGELELCRAVLDARRASPSTAPV